MPKKIDAKEGLKPSTASEFYLARRALRRRRALKSSRPSINHSKLMIERVMQERKERKEKEEKEKEEKRKREEKEQAQEDNNKTI